MKRSELERDVANIIDEFKCRDYEIPSSRQILKVVFSKLVVVYLLQTLFIVLDVVLNSKAEGYHYFDTLILASGSNVFFSLIFLMSVYQIVCVKIALGEDIMGKSIFLNLVVRKVRFYSYFLLVVNVVIGGGLLWVGERFVGGLGFSWFVTYLMSMLFLQGSLSRYMTPAVVASLSKVKELLSPGTTNATHSD